MGLCLVSLMGLCLLSNWWAETFCEGLNESIGTQTFVQTYISVSVAIAKCVCVLSITDCMSARSSSDYSGEFVCTSVLSRPSPCTNCQQVFLCLGMKRADSAWVIFKQMLKKSLYSPSCLLHAHQLKERGFHTSPPKLGPGGWICHSAKPLSLVFCSPTSA